MSVVSKPDETFHWKKRKLVWTPVAVGATQLAHCKCFQYNRFGTLSFPFPRHLANGFGMPIRYEIDKERRLVITTGTDAVHLADALAHQERLRGDPDFDPAFSQLMDYTQLTEYNLSMDDMVKIAQRRVFAPGSRRAIVVRDDLSYGLGRMFEMLRENAGEFGIRVFRNREEALNWVLPNKASA